MTQSNPTIPEVIALLHENLLPGKTLVADSPLFELGMDSLAIIQFVVLAESNFGISLDPGELTAENFSTPTAVASLLQQKAASGRFPENP